MLNDKQQAFIAAYLLDPNATQAAIKAGYSTKTAKQQGQRLLTNVDVQRALSCARAERGERTKIDADWMLLRLADEAEADLADLYDDNGHLRAVHDWPLIWRQGLVAGVETLREKVGERENGEPEYATVQKVKLSDRVKRLELIGKHIDVQAFKDKVEHDVTADLAAIIEQRRAKVHGDRS